MTLQCDMRIGCKAKVTHIGSKGWKYCTEHAKERRYHQWERCRKMRQWEIALLEKDEPLPSYKPIKKPTA